MELRRRYCAWAVAALCLTPGDALAGGANGIGTVAAPRIVPRVRVSSVSAPPSIDEPTKAALRSSVERNLSEIDTASSRAGYSVAVSLIQLRRYIGPDGDEPRTVCVLDLALRDPHDVLVASLRGRASGTGKPGAALDAAARSAVRRVPEVIRAVEKTSAPTPDARR